MKLSDHFLQSFLWTFYRISYRRFYCIVSDISQILVEEFFITHNITVMQLKVTPLEFLCDTKARIRWEKFDNTFTYRRGLISCGHHLRPTVVKITVFNSRCRLSAVQLRSASRYTRGPSRHAFSYRYVSKRLLQLSVHGSTAKFYLRWTSGLCSPHMQSRNKINSR